MSSFSETVVAYAMTPGFLSSLMETWSGYFMSAGLLYLTAYTLVGLGYPSRATWFVWLLLDGLLWLGMYVDGNLNAQINAVMVCIVPACLLIFWRGTGNLIENHVIETLH